MGRNKHTEEGPNDSNTSVIVPIFDKRDSRNWENYRGITIVTQTVFKNTGIYIKISSRR